MVWGVKSGVEFTGADITIWTDNDLALVYDKINDEFYYDVEIYHFREREDAKKYLQGLLRQFADWTRQRGEDPDASIQLSALFPATHRFDTPHEAYLHFKALVLGFCAEGGQ